MKETHGGHRSRLTEKIKNGDGLYDHEIMEALLFNACPRRDLNDTAHALLEKFGDVYSVMHATEEELCSVEGVGGNIAGYLVCLSRILDRLSACESFAVVKSTSDFLQWVRLQPPCAAGLQIYFVDKDGRARRKAELEKNGSGEELKKLYTLIAVSRPYGVFVSSYKRDGARPDEEEDGFAEKIYKAVKLCGARFYDYCIVDGHGGTFSYFVHDRSVFGSYDKAEGNYE